MIIVIYRFFSINDLPRLSLIDDFAENLDNFSKPKTS